jgi:hypothetical protein
MQGAFGGILFIPEIGILTHIDVNPGLAWFSHVVAIPTYLSIGGCE